MDLRIGQLLLVTAAKTQCFLTFGFQDFLQSLLNFRREFFARSFARTEFRLLGHCLLDGFDVRVRPAELGFQSAIFAPNLRDFLPVSACPSVDFPVRQPRFLHPNDFAFLHDTQHPSFFPRPCFFALFRAAC